MGHGKIPWRFGLGGIRVTREFFRKDAVFLRGGFVRGQEETRGRLAIVRCGSDAAMDEASPQKHDRFFENRSSLTGRAICFVAAAA
jgi:hypothetical protein